MDTLSQNDYFKKLQTRIHSGTQKVWSNLKGQVTKLKTWCPTWWTAKPLYFRITTMLTAVLGFGLTICSVATYIFVSNALTFRMRSGMQQSAIGELPDLLNSDIWGGGDVPRRVIITDPNNLPEGAQGDRMRNFGQHIANSATEQLQQTLAIYLCVTTVLVTIAGALIAYLISKKQLTKLKEGYDKMERFASDASHEIRTPLSVIKGQAELFQMKRSREFAKLLGNPKENITEADITIAKIKNSADQMEDLVNNLLLLTRVDTASSSAEGLPIEEVDLLELIEGAIEATNLRAGFEGSENSKPRDIILDFKEQKITSNYQSLKQIFTNLFTNIIKYADIEGATIKAPVTIRTAKVGKHLQITVSDHGKGVPKEELPHLFERFYTGDFSRNRATSGTGLGLAIVEQLVKNLGGNITAQATLNGGLTFKIVI